MEDKLTLFRQQAAIIARKKESTAEKLNDVRVELAAIEDEVKEKKSGELLILCFNNDFFLQFYHPLLNYIIMILAIKNCTSMKIMFF